MSETVHRALVILKRQQVQARTGLSRSGIYQKMTNGEFPKSISLGARAVGWLEASIDQWIEERIACSANEGSQQ